MTAAPQKLSVLFCYFSASADKVAAQDLYKRLEKYDWIDLWLDDKKLLPGQVREVEIKKAAATTHAIIVFLSKGAVNKPGIFQRELKIALDAARSNALEEIFIIPLRLDSECDMPNGLEDLIAADYSQKRQKVTTTEKLLESLKTRAKGLGISTGGSDESSGQSTSQDNEDISTHTEQTSGLPGLISAVVVSTAEFPQQSIPFRKNDNFTGREAVLDSIQAGFNKNQHTIRKHALTGLGGIGKTQIAVQYSYEHASEYDLVWWIRAETAASLTADYQALSNALQIDVKTRVEQTVYVNLVNNWLEHTDKKWLLVYDNVETREQIEPILPRKGQGCILITSQQNLDWREIAQDSGIAPFSPEETQTFFEKRLVEENPKDIGKLAELLGNLPLAMEQACAYMNKRGTPVATYIHLFEEQRQELWKLESAPKDYKATIATTWQMAFKQIRTSQPVAHALLSLWSFFAPDNIPLDMLRNHVDQLPTEMATIINNRLALNECLAALYSYSLITRDATQGNELISIHRLVQDVVRDSLMNNDNFQKWLGIALQILEKAFVYDEYKVATWPLCAPILPHALAAAGYAEKYSLGLELASDIYQKTGEYFRQLGEYEKAVETVQHAINIRREVLGEQHEKLAVSLDYLGEIYLEQVKIADAFKVLQQAAKILAAKNNIQDKLIARNLNNIGWVSNDQGNLKDAKEYYEEALNIRRSILGENHPDTASTLHNYGSLLYAQGNFESASKYYQEALAIKRKTLGEKHPDIAIALRSYAILLYEQRNLKSARTHAKEALSISRLVLGENHPQTALCLGDVGTQLDERGDFENARQYYEEALAISRRVFGENHPQVAYSLFNIGASLANRSKYNTARPYLEQALIIFQKVYGTKHHELLSTLANLAFVMANLGLYAKAQEYASQAIKICAEGEAPYKDCEKVKLLRKAIANIARAKYNK